MANACGIDFGASNSTVGWSRPGHNRRYCNGRTARSRCHRRDDILASADVHISGTYTTVLTSAHGNGDIYLNGTAHELQVYTYGTNFLFAEDLDIDGYMFVSTISLGDVIINATKLGQLEYLIYSSGNIRYKGNPGLIRNLGGDEDATGKLIRE